MASAQEAHRVGCDRRFGPGGAWRGYHQVVDFHASHLPDSPAVEDAQGLWSYSELRTASLRAAAFLCAHGMHRQAAGAPCWAEAPAAPRPLAIWAARSREFVALCLGAWRLGLPVVALSRDMADAGTERLRNEQAVEQLKPFAMVTDDRAHEVLGGHDSRAAVLRLPDLFEALRGEGPCAAPEAVAAAEEAERAAPVSPECVLAYVYTGGTTKASKCVTVTHAMALWEAENYSTALFGAAGPGDMFLQYSSLYWGAAVFGQLSIGFAVGACVCIGGCPQGCGGAGDALRQLVLDTEMFRITVLGVVPSQLRGAWPDGPKSAPACLHTIVVWADKCPVELSRLWQSTGKRMVDLLIASEYWLALYSDCQVWTDGTVEKHIYRKLPSLDARFLIDANGASLRDAVHDEVGEMYLAGPTTSPGYVCPDGTVSLSFHDALRVINGKAYLRTRDQLLLLKDGGLVYSGRADSLMKHGGQWVDADALQDAVTAVPGVTHAAVLPGAQGIDAFVVLQGAVADAAAAPEGEAGGESPAKRPRLAGSAPFRVLAQVRRALPSSTPGGCRIHLRTSLPLNPATAKVDRKALLAELEGLHDGQRQHAEEQDQLERRTTRHYGAWGQLALGVVCGPQVLAAAALGLAELTAGPPAAATALAAAAAQLVGVCAGRLLALPELWLAATYLEERHKDERWMQAIASVVQRFGPGLPRQLSRWLPLASSALLPVRWLGVVVASCLSYLALARERDGLLALGLGAATAALRVPPDWLPGGLPPGLTAACLGAAAALLRRRSFSELASCAVAAPGLAVQVLPKYLAEDFGYYLERRLLPPQPKNKKRARAGDAEGDDEEQAPPTSRLRRWVEDLRAPRWEGGLTWDKEAAVVDLGNQWNQVNIVGDGGGNMWNSVGIRVHLHPALAGPDSPLAAMLADGSSPKVGQGNNGSGRANGVTKFPVGGTAEGAAADHLAAIVERICGVQGADAMHSLDSMQAIQLTEAIRREFHKPVTVSDVLRCHELEQLREAVERAVARSEESGVLAKETLPEPESQPWRIWLCGAGPRTCTVDWMVSRQDRTRHLDVAALQRALDRLVARHGALRARNASEVALFDATYTAASLWQLWCAGGKGAWTRTRLGRFVSSSVYRSWPRTTVLPEGDAKAKTRLLLPTVQEVVWEEARSDDERAFWAGSALLEKHKRSGELFHVCAIPVFRDAGGAPPEAEAVEVAAMRLPEDVRWFIYAVLDHGYCDGPTGLPLFADLLRLYAEEAGEEVAAGLANQQPPHRHHPAEALAALQGRLRQSLKPMPEAEHPNDDIFHDGLVGFGYHPGFQRHIRFDQHLMRLLRTAARDNLGCSVDVAWLTCIAASFFRMFPGMRRLDFYLVVTCRDGPGEETMVGYFSSRKLMPLEVGDTSRLTLLGLADLISSTRRQRAWRRPRPFEKAGAIEVNIVAQAADGLPLGFQEVRYSRSAPRAWERGGNSNMNLRLDQTARDDWDFRLQSHDAAWGGSWSSYYAQALGSVIVDMACRPTGPVVPSATAVLLPVSAAS